MRKNLPVTSREIEVLDDHAIVSQTDLDGNIVYVNPYFLQISGFSAEELMGAPQNIIRHPDMPAQAFADLWRVIRSGTPWTGLVKNRCKNGDFYWVRANVTPIREHGQTTGYMSVRVKASRAEVEASELAYRTIRKHSGHGGHGLHIHDGRIVKPGLSQLLSRLRHVSLAARIWLCTSAVNLLLLAVCLASLFSGQGAAGNRAIFAATLLDLLINVYLWHTLRSSMLRPLARALQGARGIAAGDLSGRFDSDSGNEVGQLLRALQQMNSNLIATIRDVRCNVDTMGVATRGIAAGNRDLAGRTEAQAASLEQTAASVEQFAASVAQNAENSRRANQLALAASTLALQGGASVAGLSLTMDEINSSSRKIVDIIGLIDGIAFQTNILALNAAVEAARAGEQGKGFAVVAGEVRSLAQRSSLAARDIKGLIEVSVAKVGAGMQQAGRAGASVAQVVDAVQQVTAIMQDISQASHEQSLAVGQINSAIAHMDQVTQQNAALVEQAAAAASSLAGEAVGLSGAVSLFKFARAVPARRLVRVPARGRPAPAPKPAPKQAPMSALAA